MVVFTGQGLALMILNIVVWDRSDLVILRWLNNDVRQVTFFSTAFSLVERVLMIPTAFVGAAGVTIMAQFGRGESKVGPLTVESARYSFLIAVPLLIGMASVSGPAILNLYGGAYRPMIPVLVVTALMALPRNLLGPAFALLQTTARQGFLVIWVCVCGALDVTMDFLLTPHYGAVGAAVANGTAQTIAAVGVWLYIWRKFRPDLRLGAFGRIIVSGVTMGAAVVLLVNRFPTRPGLVVSIAAGVLIWCLLLRLTRALDEKDGERLGNVARSMPGPLRPAWTGMVHLLAPRRV
jgi:O-antigen/teichoic acid export membrane protein